MHVAARRAAQLPIRTSRSPLGNSNVCSFHGPNRFTRLEHEAANCPEQSPVAIFVNLEPATAGVRDRDPPPIIHWPAPTGGRFGAPDSSRNDALHNRGT